jgi:vesicle coat complex subunit
MEAKTKRNLIIWSVVILVLLNITSLATIWYHRYQYGNTRMDRRSNAKSMNQDNKQMKSRRGSAITAYISKGLELTDAQQHEFDSIWNKYTTLRHEAEKEMDYNRQKMGLLMSKIDIDTNEFNKLSAKQGILMQELNHSMISMNLALRGSLNEDQLELFLTKVEKMGKRRSAREPAGDRARKRTK